MLSWQQSAIIEKIIGKCTLKRYACLQIPVKWGKDAMDSIQNLIQQLPTMQWTDLLDIALVAFLFYKLMPLLKAPSTMRIARAVVAVVFISWLTEVMHLYTVHFILEQFMAVGLLAVVVLFQPELRRVLDRLGSVRLRSLLGINTKPVQELDGIISQAVTACEIMSRERIGALIVFAREAQLEDCIKTGTPIDGQVSEQLIRNIFFPKAALHDGAMIIRDGRITAAGCVLPLSDSNRLSADLGTRHRAGVGMSENSDAVVVIVSEETGTISVAVGGMLKRHLASKTLERLLRNELCPEQADQQDGLAVKLRQKLNRKEKEASRNEE